MKINSNTYCRQIIQFTILLLVSALLISCSEKKEIDKHYTIGLVSNNPNGLKNIQGFCDEMENLGYIEGQNTTYIFSGKPTAGAELESVFNNMIREKVDLIFTAGTPTGVAAYHATKNTGIPVVFGVIADPVAAGVMSDTSKPGGNMTGVRLSNNQGRRLELLLEIAPQVGKVVIPYNPNDAAPSSAVTQIREISSKFEVEIMEVKVSSEEEVRTFIENFPEDGDALFMLPDTLVSSFLPDLIALSLEHKIPVSGPSVAQLSGGALTVYGIIHNKAGAQAANIASQILHGADPGLLPVETAELYQGINLKTAEAIGLEISNEILLKTEIIIHEDI